MSVAATGFEDAASKADHFRRQGEDFAAESEAEYQEMARGFLNGPLTATAVRCIRRGNGDLIRYDKATEAFAVMRNDGIIKTFYKPQVNWHGFLSNLAYFQAECAK